MSNTTDSGSPATHRTLLSRHRRMAPLGAFALALQLALTAPAFGSTNESPAIDFTVKGTLTVSNRVFDRILKTTNYTVEVIPFSLDRRGASWRLNASIPFSYRNGTTKETNHITVGYDGGDVFSVSRSVSVLDSSAAFSPGEATVQASVTPGPTPSFRFWHRAIWFAFVGHSSSPTDYEARIDPPYPYPSGEMVDARVRVLPGVPHLAGQVSFHTVHARPWPIGQYSVVRTTNFNGLTLPTEFLLIQWKSGATTNTVPEISQAARGIIDVVTACEADDMLPTLAGPVQTLDYRFHDPKKGVHDLMYTNAQWVSRADTNVQRLVQEALNRPKGHRRIQQPARGLQLATILTVGIIAIAPLALLLRRRRPASTGKKVPSQP